jgi:hypothetical protein
MSTVFYIFLLFIFFILKKFRCFARVRAFRLFYANENAGRIFCKRVSHYEASAYHITAKPYSAAFPRRQSRKKANRKVRFIYA